MGSIESGYYFINYKTKNIEFTYYFLFHLIDQNQNFTNKIYAFYFIKNKTKKSKNLRLAKSTIIGRQLGKIVESLLFSKMWGQGRHQPFLGLQNTKIIVTRAEQTKDG